MALASVLFYGAGKTHIYPVYFWVLFDDHEAITTLSRGRAALRGENGPRHDSVKLLSDNAVLPSLQVRVLQASLQDNYVYLVCGRRFCSSRWDGCCCARAGLLQVRPVYTSFEDIYKLANTWYLHLLNLISGEHLRSCATLLQWW